MIETEEQFVGRRRADWDELDRLADQSWNRMSGAEISRGAALYRSVAADLMRARGAGFSPDVIARLDGLAGRAHAALYSAPPYRFGAIAELVRWDFPRAVRRHARLMWFATFLFVVPGLVGFAGAHRSRSFALHVLPEAMIEQMEQSYAHDPSVGRQGGDNAMMAGFYVYNNVGIAFRCFATGILFGLGSVFFLVYNGLMIGAVFGLVTASGHAGNLLTFASGHGAFELTAIVISGAAGMVTGQALVVTEGRTRLGSLRRRARDIAHLILGAALMLLVAAGLEGFWSPSGVPARVKWFVAGGLWLVVFAYLALAGRRDEVAHEPA